MLDITDLDSTTICRDDNCDEEGVHPKHLVKPRRPKKAKVRSSTWDAKGLAECIHRVILSTEWPQSYADIKSAVIQDYGTTTDRAIHRHLARLCKTRSLIRISKAELGLAFSAYIAPTSRWRHDPDNLREHLVGRRCRWLPTYVAILGQFKTRIG